MFNRFHFIFNNKKLACPALLFSLALCLPIFLGTLSSFIKAYAEAPFAEQLPLPAVHLAWSTSKAINDSSSDKPSIAPGKLSRERIEINGKNRHYYLYQPAGYDGKTSLPLVLVFHGYKMNGRTMMSMTGFNQLADKEGFLVAYPEVLEVRWNKNSKILDEEKLPEDVVFVKKLIDTLAQDIAVDTNRVYATGFSDGGFFSHQLACQLSDRIAAFAPVASTMGVTVQENCNPKRPIPMLLINGTDDPIVSFDGKITGVLFAFKGTRILPMPHVLRYWSNTNHCSKQYQGMFLTDLDFADEMSVQINHYPNCDPGSAVEQVLIHHGGHAWPGSTDTSPLLNLVIGRTIRSFEASPYIWNFFKQYALEPEVPAMF